MGSPRVQKSPRQVGGPTGSTTQTKFAMGRVGMLQKGSQSLNRSQGPRGMGGVTTRTKFVMGSAGMPQEGSQRMRKPIRMEKKRRIIQTIVGARLGQVEILERICLKRARGILKARTAIVALRTRRARCVPDSVMRVAR